MTPARPRGVAALLFDIGCVLLLAVLPPLVFWQVTAPSTAADSGGAGQWERTRRPEYARFATSIRPVESVAAAREVLRGYDPATWEPVPVASSAQSQSLRTVLQELWPEAIDPVPNAIPDPAFFSKVLVYEPDRLTLLVQNRARGLLVIDEPVLPGWDAYVDGLPTPIVRANGMQRAVILAPALEGRPHEVTFVYRPVGARSVSAARAFALALAAGAVCALVVVAVGQARSSARNIARV